jgi:hypothetical protein
VNRAPLLVHHQYLDRIAGNVEPVEPIANAVHLCERFSGRLERVNEDCGRRRSGLLVYGWTM